MSLKSNGLQRCTVTFLAYMFKINIKYQTINYTFIYRYNVRNESIPFQCIHIS